MARWIEPPLSSAGSPLPGLPPLVAETLVRRGITTPEAAQAFLSPAAYSPAQPSDLPGLSEAADRLEQAIRQHESICVWGDFDVDGQTSTTILYSTLLAMGAEVTYHIPVRARESHGVNLPVLKEFLDQGIDLILTCDTGISAHEAVEYARSRQVDVIISDHHDLPENLPRAAALIDPKLLGADHPLATLSGSGVAYKLAEELLARSPSASLSPDSLLDLAALGLVADLALLVRDARYLVQRGLESLRHPGRLGLRVMLEMADLNPSSLTEEHIGFVLGPRLNALGRLGDANPAVELLTTNDPGRARLIATQLEGLNIQRQLLTEQVTQAAEAQLRADPSILAQPVLVLAHPDWPGGIVGIAASRLVDRYHRPAILLSTPPDEPAHGSARSIEGVNITAAIRAQKDLLIGFGGHPMAAGLSLETDKLPEFRSRLAKTVQKMMGAVEKEATLQINTWLALTDVQPGLAEEVEQLAPFGPGNEKPVLASRSLRLQTSTAIGRNQEHLKLNVTDEQGNARTVLWWNGTRETLPEGKFDLAFTVRSSDWRGIREVQLEFVDYRNVEEKPVEILKAKIEVVDYRALEERPALLKSLPEGTLVWAEGEDKKKVTGSDRTGLSPADTLAIWTTPPSLEILRTALETVRPQRVILFAVSPATDMPEAFLGRLAGLVKYAIGKRAGQSSLTELAAATAQPKAAVRLGLEWLAAKGQLSYKVEGDGLVLGTGRQNANPYALGDLDGGIRTALAETRAYHVYFQHADKDTLILPLQN